MKKTILFAAGLSLILTLFAQQSVKIKDATPFWFVYMEFKGSRIETPEKVNIFFQEIRKQELQTSISNDLFCILFDSPYQVGEVRDVWAPGFEIPEGTPVQLPLKKYQYHYRKIATMIYKGSYDTVGQAYNIILPYLEERDFEIVGPPVEKWLDDPNQVHKNILHTAVLKWVLKHDFITTAIPGYTNYQQMEEDFSVACDLDYTLEEKKFLQDRNVILALKGNCQQCSRCVPTCPYGVDIPTLMRVHMYALCYSNFSLARDTLNEIPNGKGLERCISCSQCEASCANRVDIASRIDELGKITAGKKFDREFIQIRKQRGMPLNHN